MKALVVLSSLCLSVLACEATIPGDGMADKPDARVFVDASPLIDAEPGVVYTINVSPTSVAMKTGESKSISPTVTENGATSSTTILWSSNDPTIATVDTAGIITGTAVGQVTVTAMVPGNSADVSVTVSAASCIDGTGHNNDPCDDIYQGADIWRCTKQNGQTISQVCRDSGGGAKWVSFQFDPQDCCNCMGSFSVSCCQTNDC